MENETEENIKLLRMQRDNLLQRAETLKSKAEGVSLAITILENSQPELDLNVDRT